MGTRSAAVRSCGAEGAGLCVGGWVVLLRDAGPFMEVGAVLRGCCCCVDRGPRGGLRGRAVLSRSERRGERERVRVLWSSVEGSVSCAFNEVAFRSLPGGIEGVGGSVPLRPPR